ncbi:unnamed protein product [Danaus chrysippus]|uniref:(African queen) hypothetical protein n=1 Tax=Danaus chrysippus TaxID=151541 RepID=A0A8J2VYE4_9NEOP|nr:unnamed protein product [Danaus chrysippus]
MNILHARTHVTQLNKASRLVPGSSGARTHAQHPVHTTGRRGAGAHLRAGYAWERTHMARSGFTSEPLDDTFFTTPI